MARKRKKRGLHPGDTVHRRGVRGVVLQVRAGRVQVCITDPSRRPGVAWWRAQDVRRRDPRRPPDVEVTP